MDNVYLFSLWQTLDKLKLQTEENKQQEQLIKMLQADKHKAIQALQKNGVDTGEMFNDEISLRGLSSL